jgi:hypothetical protein
MKLKVKDKKFLINEKYFCDTNQPAIPRGVYPVTFRHSTRFNRLMPVIENVPEHDEVLICWSRETCHREQICRLCDAIQVGRRFSGEELKTCRDTFNQVYDRIRRMPELTLEIQ